jgi:hypothetical protein
MATTPNYNYNLPIVGGDFELWGGMLNTNWTEIDIDLKAANDAIDAAELLITAANTNADGRVSKAGDTMTGPLVLPATEPTNNSHAAKKQYVDTGELAQAARYLFSVGLTDVDPGAGKIGVNTANAKDATRIYVSTSCVNGKTTPILANFVDGVVIGLSRSDRTIYYRITSTVDHTTWYTLTVVALGTGISFPAPAADATILLTFLGYLKPEVAPAPLYTDYTISTWSYVSGKTQAHGLGHVPSDVRVLFKCVSTDTTGGYAVGDHIFLSVGSTNSQAGFTLSADITNVYLGIGERIYYQEKGGAINNLALSTALWDIVLRVWP